MAARTEPQRWFLNLAIGSLCISALVAIVAVTGDVGDETTGKIAATFLAISFYNGTSLTAASLAQRRPELVSVSVLVWSLSALGLLTALFALWIADSGDNGRVAWAFVVATAASAHASIVLMRRLQHEGPARALDDLAVASIAVLAAMAVYAILAEVGDDLYLRLLGVAGIVAAHGTFVAPLVDRTARERTGEHPRQTVIAVQGMLIGVLTVAALIGIAALLGGSVEEDAGRLLLTLGFLALYGTTALAGLGLRRSREDYRLLGEAAVVASVLALITAVNVIWISDFAFEGDDGETDFRIAWGFFVAAIASALASLLLLREQPQDAPSVRAVVRSTLLAVTVTAAILLYWIAFDPDVGEGGATLIAVVLILDILGFALLPVMRKRSALSGEKQ